jgi:urease accessory protein UreH
MISELNDVQAAETAEALLESQTCEKLSKSTKQQAGSGIALNVPMGADNGATKEDALAAV